MANCWPGWQSPPTHGSPPCGVGGGGVSISNKSITNSTIVVTAIIECVEIVVEVQVKVEAVVFDNSSTGTSQ